MKKKILSMAMTTALLVTMFSGTAMASEATTPAWGENGGSSTVEGNSYTVNPIIEVELPGDLSFGINPLYLDADENAETDDTQIVTADYLITNYSNVDVLITAKTTVTLGTNVQLATDPAADEDSGELPAVPDKKNIYLAQMYPKNVTLTEGVATLDRNVVTMGTTTVDNIAGRALVSGEEGITALFKLTAFDHGTGELKVANVSGFTFDGAVDPDSTFLDEDVKVKTVFTLNTLTTNQGTNLYEGLVLNSGTYADSIVQEKSN